MSAAKRKKRAADDDSDSQSEGEANEETQPVGMLEKIATALSMLLIAGILGVLVRDALHRNTLPSFTTSTGQISRTAGLYRVPVTVRNTGDESAKSVLVHLELMAADSTLAESDMTVDWLPGNSSRDLVGIFKQESSGPTPTNVQVDVRGYIAP